MSEGKRALLLVIMVYFLYIQQEEQAKVNGNRIQVKITSKQSSNVRLHETQGKLPPKSSKGFEEIQKLIDHTQTLSFELIQEFDKDIKNSKVKAHTKKQIHPDFMYHGNDKKIESRICKNPYQLVAICLDGTNQRKHGL